MIDPQLSAQIVALPCWSGAITVEPLIGGMTNRNCLVTDSSGARYVLRVGRDLTEHGVLRFNELAAARAAHAAGISPEVVYSREGLLVSRYVDGRTLEAADVREAGQLLRIVELLRDCHERIPRHLRGPALIFWVFQVIRNYVLLLGEPGANPLGVDLEPLAARAVRLEKAVGPVHIVFGHNDLLAANLIDDGSRLWLIDWDYAGFNSPLFDLANLASNNEFTPELEDRLLTSYFGAAPGAECRRGFAAMKCAALLREVLWGCVSLVHSKIDFDYTSYARDYLLRFDRSWVAFERRHGA